MLNAREGKPEFAYDRRETGRLPQNLAANRKKQRFIHLPHGYLPLFLYFPLLFGVLAYYDISTGVSTEFDWYFYLALLFIVISFLLIRRIVNKSASLVGWLWFVWPLFGIAYAASFNRLQKTWELRFDINMSFFKPLFIHYIFLIFFCIGVVFFEKLSGKISFIKKPLNRDYPKMSMRFFLYVFPLVHLIALYLAWGFIPILSGINIVDQMYEIKTGITQQLGAVIFYSVLMTAHNTIKAKHTHTRYIWAAITLFFMLIAAGDGKRIILMLCCMGVYQLLFKSKENIPKVSLAILLGFALVSYFLLAIIRSFEIGSFNFESILSGIGVEFMTFAWTVTYYEPGQIPGYSWIASTFSSMINSSLLEIFGIDKEMLIRQDSATAWSGLFNSKFGIRSGIVSELYFEFSYWGALVFAALGILFAKLCMQMQVTTSYLNYFFLLGIYSLCALAIMNQSTVTFGAFTSFFYVWLAFKLISKLLIGSLDRRKFRRD